MMTRNKTTGLLLIASLLTIGFASVYAKGGNSFGKGGLPAIVLSLEAEIEELKLRITALEEGGVEGPEGPEGPQGEPGPQGPPGFGAPDYDSGWVPIQPALQDESLRLELGFSRSPDKDYVVYMTGRFPWGPEHQWWEAGGGYASEQVGCMWQFPSEPEFIDVKRHMMDIYWQEVRVRVWQIPDPT